MMRQFFSFMFPDAHKQCVNKIHNLTTAKAEGDKKICSLKAERDKKVYSLEHEINLMLTQIQELKAINDYQTWQLEKQIADLKEQYRLCKIEVEVLERNKPKETDDRPIGTTISERATCSDTTVE